MSERNDGETGSKGMNTAFPEGTIWLALEKRARMKDAPAVLIEGNRSWSAAELLDRAQSLAKQLARLGIGSESRVLTLLPNKLEHVLLFLSLARLGALWIPLSPEQSGPALLHVLKTVDADLIVTTPGLENNLRTTGMKIRGQVFVVANSAFEWGMPSDPVQDLPPYSGQASDWRGVIFTSGTTGPPKGVVVTEYMFFAAAMGTAWGADLEDGDRFLLWEPLYHIGGSQLLVLALLQPITLVLVPRFSASRFWEDVRNHDITKIHYLGGILEILLTKPATAEDKAHAVKLAFGAGARPEIWRNFQERFGIPLREVYGLTEASSFSTVNTVGVVGSMGQPLPWMDITLIDAEGNPVDDGKSGEIVIQPKLDGLLTPGYFRDDEASKSVLRDGRLYTGDLACRDKQGFYYFTGRLRDSIRRRGENLSAWEIETALSRHPEIAECAAIGVPSEIGEEDILVYVRLVEGIGFDPARLAAWAEANLPVRIRPRYWLEIAEFPRTPSGRIAKRELGRDPAKAFNSDH